MTYRTGVAQPQPPNVPKDERPAEPGYCLQHNGRYCHREPYVRTVLADAGLTSETVALVVLRKEMDQPVHGLLVTASRRGY